MLWYLVWNVVTVWAWIEKKLLCFDNRSDVNKISEMKQVAGAKSWGILLWCNISCIDVEKWLCRVRRLREGIWLSANTSDIDIIARTRNRRCVQYIEILKDVYTDSTSAQREWDNQDQERSKAEERHLTKLFTTTMVEGWTGRTRAWKIDREFLNNLRFADDIFICTGTPQEQQMIQELSDESRRMGLKMNIAKTKVMVVDNTQNNVLIEKVKTTGTRAAQQNQGKEPGQRDATKNHGRLGAIRQTPGYLQKQCCHLPEERCTTPVWFQLWHYGAETWTKQAQNKLAAAQTKMERSMLNNTCRDRRTNIWVRERKKVIYIISNMRKKWSGPDQAT